MRREGQESSIPCRMSHPSMIITQITLGILTLYNNVEFID